MLSLEQYKKLLGDRLKGLIEEEIEFRYRFHTTFLAFIVKQWLKSLENKQDPPQE